jgi:hypothetical protein
MKALQMIFTYVALLLQSSDILTSAFSTFADIVAQSNVIKAQEELEEAQRKLQEAQELKMAQDAQIANNAATRNNQSYTSFDPYGVQSFDPYASSSSKAPVNSYYAPATPAAQQSSSTPYGYGQTNIMNTPSSYSYGQPYEMNGQSSSSMPASYPTQTSTNPFQSFEPYTTLNQPQSDYSSISRNPFENPQPTQMYSPPAQPPATGYSSITAPSNYSSLSPQRSNTNPFAGMSDQRS